ncbi:MAG: 4-(cytidine 5'-diphospho)-2-C-methyl-D-erythritol kinase [Acidobacteriota bacterium]|nr:4-(cytidine 5'-diphospho)-2-C-methyl-D-erythritol kinase [Acidobacteriota bacterium]
MKITIPSFAKLNLDLRVLHKRPDGFHELRTIYQTISLKDTLTVEFEIAKRTQVNLSSSIDIVDNLVVRSAKLVLDRLRIAAWLRFTLSKKIPIGAGMGGGSSNAAAVLIALSALIAHATGKKIPATDLVRLAESLGSDVPFFLYGGTALGIGRGTEIYPLPDQPSRTAVVVASGVHVSTPEAYRSLNRTLTSTPESPILREFQTIAWDLDGPSLGRLPLKNDFEDAVFEVHPRLAGFVRKLRRLGGRPALMTGSGSAVFGIFSSAAKAREAARAFPGVVAQGGLAQTVGFVSRRQYRRTWRRALGPVAEASCFSLGRGD